MKKILFLGTSHVGCFVKAQTRLEPLEGFEFHFRRLSVPDEAEPEPPVEV